VRTTNFTVFLVSGVFFVLLLINLILDMQLKDLKEERDGFVKQIDRNAAIEKNVLAVSSQINTYKDVKGNYPPLYDPFKYVISAIEKRSEMENFRFSRSDGNFLVNLNARRATDYAYLIADLLNSDNIESIVIRSVQAIPNQGQYEATLEIIFK
jgi:hypothetical protein